MPTRRLKRVIHLGKSQDLDFRAFSTTHAKAGSTFVTDVSPGYRNRAIRLAYLGSNDTLFDHLLRFDLNGIFTVSRFTHDDASHLA
ncbi:hypothetical protein Q31b_06710 [Novipirellula aureliae]|uniref:Uncharacterized protein n=1 Tax=Novipirellula aureliae TaxID=2527966 RepID=A0A5C6EE54_9BACT|nr:hypothetical protein Q31b_06710 [Novipirellula aureliae]